MPHDVSRKASSFCFGASITRNLGIQVKTLQYLNVMMTITSLLKENIFCYPKFLVSYYKNVFQKHRHSPMQTE